MSSDIYVDSATGILKNRLELKDAVRLDVFETEVILQRYRQGFPKIELDPQGYCAIHHHLFQDVYVWAGQYREVELAKNTIFFCRPAYIAQSMNILFKIIQTHDYGSGLVAEDFAKWLATQAGELNAIHPFREGNGRALRAFMEIVGARAGFSLDLTMIKPEPWLEASILSFQKSDISLMTKIILAALHKNPD